ncbi:2-hydroxyacyl-CoA lyase [Tanacetum coccineum]
MPAVNTWPWLYSPALVLQKDVGRGGFSGGSFDNGTWVCFKAFRVKLLGSGKVNKVGMVGDAKKVLKVLNKEIKDDHAPSLSASVSSLSTTNNPPVTPPLPTASSPLAVKVKKVEEIPDAVFELINVSGSGRPGGCYLDIPADVLHETLTELEAQKLLDEAETKFVKETGIPFLPTPYGKGLLPDTHELAATAARSLAIGKCDVCVVIGARLNWLLHFGEPPKWSKDVKFVCDIDEGEISYGKPYLGVFWFGCDLRRDAIIGVGSPAPIVVSEGANTMDVGRSVLVQMNRGLGGCRDMGDYGRWFGLLYCCSCGFT